MKRKRFSPEQIIKILKESETRFKVIDLCRKYGISDQTFYNWRNKDVGMSVSDARKLKALEKEYRRLKRLVADLAKPCKLVFC